MLKLLGSLANGGCANVASIAKQLGVSRRTVFRDLETLRGVGVKVRFDRPHQAYHVEHDEAAAAVPRSQDLDRPTLKEIRAPRYSDLEELIRLVYVNTIPQTLAHRRRAIRAAGELAEVLSQEAQKRLQSLLASIQADKFSPADKRIRQTFDLLTDAIASSETVSLGFHRAPSADYALLDIFPLRMKPHGNRWALEALIMEGHRSLRISLEKIHSLEAGVNPVPVKPTDSGIDWDHVDVEVL